MIKTTITFNRGATLNLEFETPTQLAEFVKKYEGGEVASVKKTEPIQSNVQNSKLFVKNRPGQRKSRIEWSESDFLGVARVVYMNLDERHNTKVAELVRKYLKTHGETKARAEATIYGTTSGLRAYFNGRGAINNIGKRMQRILDGNGLYPATGLLNVSTPKEIRRLTVTEA